MPKPNKEIFWQELIKFYKIDKKNLFYFEKLNSTNDFLKNLTRKKNKPAICYAEFQTSGRGRRENSWICNKNEGLLMSYLFETKMDTNLQPLLAQAASLAVAKTLLELFSLKAKIKWPNDITVKQKKIAGILCEFCSKHKNKKLFVCGFGVNLSNENFTKFEAISLKKLGISSTKIFPGQISGKIIQKFSNYVKKIELRKTDKLLKKIWQISLLANKKICFQLADGSQMIGQFISLGKNGSMIFNTQSGEIKEIYNAYFIREI